MPSKHSELVPGRSVESPESLRFHLLSLGWISISTSLSACFFCLNGQSEERGEPGGKGRRLMDLG